MKTRLSREAGNDLEEIWDFIAPDDPLAADAFIAELMTVVKLLGDSPLIGRTRDDLAKGLRSHPHGAYLVFYIIRVDVVQVIRIVHGGRDLRALFGSPR